MLCLAGYSSLQRAGSSVTVGSFSLGPSANKVPPRCLAVALKTLSFESTPPVSDQASFLAGFALADRCCFFVLYPDVGYQAVLSFFLSVHLPPCIPKSCFPVTS